MECYQPTSGHATSSHTLALSAVIIEIRDITILTKRMILHQSSRSNPEISTALNNFRSGNATFQQTSAKYHLLKPTLYLLADGEGHPKNRPSLMHVGFTPVKHMQEAIALS